MLTAVAPRATGAARDCRNVRRFERRGAAGYDALKTPREAECRFERPRRQSYDAAKARRWHVADGAAPRGGRSDAGARPRHRGPPRRDPRGAGGPEAGADRACRPRRAVSAGAFPGLAGRPGAGLPPCRGYRPALCALCLGRGSRQGAAAAQPHHLGGDRRCLRRRAQRLLRAHRRPRHAGQRPHPPHRRAHGAARQCLRLPAR